MAFRFALVYSNIDIYLRFKIGIYTTSCTKHDVGRRQNVKVACLTRTAAGTARGLSVCRCRPDFCLLRKPQSINAVVWPVYKSSSSAVTVT